MNNEKQVPLPRIPLHVDVEFKKSYARQIDKGILRNISLSGAFLQHVNKELQPEDKVSITFNVSGRIRKVLATVIWSNGSGSGIKFKPFNQRDIQIVDDLMYFAQNSRSTRKNVLDNIFKNVG